MLLEPQPRKRNRPRLFLILAILFASLIGGLAGGGLVYFALGPIPDPTPQPVLEDSQPLSVEVDINTAITDAVSKVGPAVVTVINNLPPQPSLFGNSIDRQASGSGVIVTSDGYIVTNNHVIEGSETIEVIFADGEVGSAELVGVDKYADLAVLKIFGNTPAVAEWGNSDNLKPGETVIAIGSPLGDFKNTVTVGVVSATERSLEVEPNYLFEGLIQTDAAINQGNSGGPLVNLSGQVVGINTLIVRGNQVQGAVAEGLGFASSSNTARAIVDQIINKGYVARPYLGIRYGVITPSLAARWDLPVEGGIVLSEVIRTGPAYGAGLRQGDIIISINGQRIDEDHPFINQLFEYEPGDQILFQVLKGQDELEIQVILGERPSP